MKTLILMRGLPGSGKSTLAKKLADNSSSVYSTDDFFVGDDGVYRFNPRALGRAHEWNLTRAKRAMEAGFPTVVVDNTNTQAWEMKAYVETAVTEGYEVVFRVPVTEWAFDVAECAKRNTHGVPRKAIQRMNDRFEWNLTTTLVLNSRAPRRK